MNFFDLKSLNANTSSNGFVVKQQGLSTQAKDYIKTNDANNDGTLNFTEFKEAGGLTGDIKANVSDTILEKLYISFAGNDKKLTAREAAQAWLYMDSIGDDEADKNDFVITQAQSDAFYDELKEIALPELANPNAKPDLAHGSELNYDRIRAVGELAGLTRILGAADNQKTADDIAKTSKADSTKLVSETKASLKQALPILRTLLENNTKISPEQKKQMTLILYLVEAYLKK
jgi:hypothetical protein